MTYIEDEIRQAIIRLTWVDARDADIVVGRFGLEDDSPRTLDDLGRQYGLSKERIRQICARAKEHVQPGRWPMMQQLTACLETLSGCLPCTAEAVRKRLVEQGLSRGRIDGRGLVTAALFFGRDPGVITVDCEQQPFFVGAAMPYRGGKARVIARKLIGRHGVTTTGQVAAAILDGFSDEDLDSCESVVRLELDASVGIVWLDEQKQWLWMPGIPEGRNRLLNNVARVLSVTDRISAAELRRALRRDIRMGKHAPPASVLLALAEKAPGLRREGAYIAAIRKYNKVDYLSETDLAMAEFITAKCGVVKYEDVRDAMRSRGIGDPTFRFRMSFPLIVRKYARGVYGLSGVEVASEEVAALIHPVRRSRVLQDCGWTDDGNVWIAYELSENTVDSAVLTVPASVREFIVGEYRLRDEAEDDVGTLIISENAGWGIRRYLRLAGAQAGDTLLIVFILENGIARAYLGDESIRDDVLLD